MNRITIQQVNPSMTVSVIIPTYNYAQFIGDAIESILTQENFTGTIEIIVIDDGSKDNTKDIVLHYANRGVRYVFQENQGKAKATQTGFEHATGKYWFNLDADDFYMPTRIAEAVAIFEKDPDIVHIGHPAIVEVTQNSTQNIESIPLYLLNRKISGKMFLQEFYLNRFFYGGGSTFSVRAEVMKKFVIPTGVDMYTDEFLVIFSANEGFSFLIDHPLSIGRNHGQNFSWFAQTPDIIRKKHERLIKSSEILDEAIQSHHFELFTKNLMTLNHSVRKLAFEEEYGKKKFGDVLNLWKEVLRIAKPWQKNFYKILKNYNILNRSIPAGLLKMLKKMK